MICKLQDLCYTIIHIKYFNYDNVVPKIRLLSLDNRLPLATEHAHFKSKCFLFVLLIPRSPSPEPIYSSDGKRLNTREFRYRKRLEEQRHQLIVKMQAVNPEFKPPADYK